MSATVEPTRRLTVSDIAKLYADGQRIPMLTAYDYPTAQLLDEAGIPMILVGDSLGEVMLGYDSTVRVTMAEMLHHTRAVVRGTRAGARRRRHAVPLVRHARRGARERRPVPPGRRRPGGQDRGRRPLRPDRRDARPGRHPGDGPHRLDAPGQARHGRQGPGPGQVPRPGPGAPPRRAGDPGGRRVRDGPRARPGGARRRHHASGCASRRSASGPAPAAAARSWSSRTCSASARSCPRHARPYADLRETILDGRDRPYAAGRRRPARSPGRSNVSRMDDEVLADVLGQTGPIDPATRTTPAGGIPLDRDL